jgi:hypothetical protein
VSQIVEGNRRFDVVMRLSDQDRSTTAWAISSSLRRGPRAPAHGGHRGGDRRP